jgi:hypothetical protein
LACLFIYAGIYKLVSVHVFEEQMAQSPLVPPEWISSIAMLVPGSEIALGFLLVFFSRLNMVTLSIAYSLMVFFSLYLAALFTLFSRPPCACGGILSTMPYPVHITFNLFFTILAAIGLLLQYRLDQLHANE